MARWKTNSNKRERRHLRIRKKVRGDPGRPRLAVYRSLNHIYAQVINDVDGRTIVSASSAMKDAESRMKGAKGKVGRSSVVGELIAERAKEAGISTVSFDRGGYLYHGRVRALAEGARKGGLEF